MSIYLTLDSIVESYIKQVSNFRPTRLYIKKIDKHLYFGKTSRKDVHAYQGSGVVWKRIIKKYGSHNIQTLWVSDVYTDPIECQKDALRFSIENDIVKNEVWTNVMFENGIDGRSHMSDEERERMSNRMTGKYVGELNPNYGRQHSEEIRRMMSTKRSQDNTGRSWFNNGTINTFSHTKPDGDEWVLGRLNKKNPFSQKNWVNAKTTSGEIIRVSKDDDRFATGELSIWSRFDTTYITPWGSFKTANAISDSLGRNIGTTITKFCKTPRTLTFSTCKRLSFPENWIGRSTSDIGFSISE